MRSPARTALQAPQPAPRRRSDGVAGSGSRLGRVRVMRHLRRRLLMLSVGGVAAALVGAGPASAATAPVPSTAAASDVTSTAATLNGVVAPSGRQVAYEFQYGTSTS